MICLDKAHSVTYVQRGLLDVKKMQGLEKRASADELILSAKLRPFARFCSSSEFRCLVLGMCAEHDIRVALSDLMDLRRNGITSLAEADQFRAERAKRESRRGDTRIKVAPDVAGLPQDRASRYAQRAGDTGLKQNIPMEAAPREVQRLLESSGLGPESRVPPLELLRAAKDGFLASQILPGMDALTEEECGLCSSLRILPCQLLAAKFVAPRVLARDGEVTRVRSPATDVKDE